MRTFYPTLNTQKRYIHNFYRIKKIRDNYLLITEQGGWIFLTKDEYTRFLRYELQPEERNLLENKGVIITGDNYKQILDNAHGRYQFLDFGVTLHILIPTLRCNHRCIYCHSSAASTCETEKEMTPETADKIIDFIFQTPSHQIKIEFQGGEPLLNFDVFKHVVKRAKEKNRKAMKKMNITLVTNLTLLDEEKLDWITKEGVSITTSLDGPKELHDANRIYEEGHGTYDNLAKKLRFVKEKEVNIGAIMVTTKKSLDHWNGIVDEYLRWGFNNFFLKHLSKLGYAQDDWPKIGYTAEEFVTFWKKTMDYIMALGRKGVIFNENVTVLMMKKILQHGDPGFLDFRSPCGIAIGQLAYNHDGDIYSCDEGRNYEMFNLGNVKDKTYKEVISSIEAQQLCESSIIDNYYCDACSYKPFCGTCPVLNYAENNNIIPKTPLSMRCKILKAQFDWIFEKMGFDQEVQRNIYQHLSTNIPNSIVR